MHVYGSPYFEYGPDHGASGHFQSTLQHRSIPTSQDEPVIKITLFFVRAAAAAA